MAELEKKLSDYQQSECKDFKLDEADQAPEKVCPTCTPNPNFVLPAEWWEIPEAYLNEAECEFHVALNPVIIGPDDDSENPAEIADRKINNPIIGVVPSIEGEDTDENSERFSQAIESIVVNINTIKQTKGIEGSTTILMTSPTEKNGKSKLWEG